MSISDQRSLGVFLSRNKNVLAVIRPTCKHYYRSPPGKRGKHDCQPSN
jgi:hypothetical protein